MKQTLNSSETLRKYLSQFKDKAEMVTYMSRLTSMEKDDLYQVYAGVSGYEEVPVDIDRFIEDEYYLGQVLRDANGDIQVFDCWRDTLRKVYPNPFHSPYLEIILSGAIGIGKTTIGVIGALYDCYRIQCLQNPQSTFKLISTTRIVYALLSIIKDLSKGVILDQLHSYINNSRYFRRLLEQSAVLKKTTGDKTLFPKRIDIVAGSKLRHTLSQAVFGAILDEVNFGDAAAEFKMYTSILARMKSRFMSAGGVIPGHVWLLSSKKEETDALEKHIKDTAHVPTTLVEMKAIWEVKTFAYTLNRWFPVFIGDELADPCIITDDMDINSFDQNLIIFAPWEHWVDFNNDISMALNDLAGVASVMSKKLFKSKTAIKQCMDKRINPISRMEFSLTNAGDDQISDFVLWPLYTQLYPDKSVPRYIHIDLSTTGDCATIASAIPYGVKPLSRFNPQNMQRSLHYEPQVAVEWAISMKPQPGHPIVFHKIRLFLLQLRERGYRIERVTADGFQSFDMRQLLELAGFKADLLSVDRQKEPYNTLRNAMVERRCFLPWIQKLFDELGGIVDTGKKYDHVGEGSSKDLADSCCGAVYSLLTNNKGIVLNRPLTLDQELDEVLGHFFPESQIFNLPGRFIGG